MPNTKHDYIALKNQYVQGTMSIRELCRANDIAAWSSVAAKAKKEDWDALRRSFQSQVENKSLEHLAQKRAMKVAEIGVDALNVLHAGILKMAEDMDEIEYYEVDGKVHTRKVMRIYPRDLAILIDKFQSLIGQPQQVSESRSLSFDVTAQTDVEVMRELLAAVRPVAAAAGAGSTHQGPDTSRTRTN